MARPALPTSSSDFALPAPAISPDNHHRDEPLAKTRRQSVLASHLSSPLAESFTLRVPQTQDAASDSDRQVDSDSESMPSLRTVTDSSDDDAYSDED